MYSMYSKCRNFDEGQNFKDIIETTGSTPCFKISYSTL